jgi:hypothetical protein
MDTAAERRDHVHRRWSLLDRLRGRGRVIKGRTAHYNRRDESNPARKNPHDGVRRGLVRGFGGGTDRPRVALSDWCSWRVYDVDAAYPQSAPHFNERRRPFLGGTPKPRARPKARLQVAATHHRGGGEKSRWSRLPLPLDVSTFGLFEIGAPAECETVFRYCNRGSHLASNSSHALRPLSTRSGPSAPLYLRPGPPDPL